MNSDLKYYLQDNVHIFEWKRSNRRVVDLWLQKMSQIVQHDGTLDYVVIDFSEIGLPPVRYLSQQVRKWLQQHPPSNRGATIAVIYSHTNLPFLIVARSYKVTLSRGRNVQLEFFADNAIDDAVDWINTKMAQDDAPIR